MKCLRYPWAQARDAFKAARKTASVGWIVQGPSASVSRVEWVAFKHGGKKYRAVKGRYVVYPLSVRAVHKTKVLAQKTALRRLQKSIRWHEGRASFLQKRADELRKAIE